MMTDCNAEPTTDPAHELLERLFHEPSRLAIMSALCAAERGMSFVAIRDSCHLSDGNLNRHLKVLVDAGAVAVSKRFVKNKPLTTASITEQGLQRFQEYLMALSQVLEDARRALPGEARSDVVTAQAAVAPAS